MTYCIIVDRFYSLDEVSSGNISSAGWHHYKIIHNLRDTIFEEVREEATKRGYGTYPYRFRIVRHAWPNRGCESSDNASLSTIIKSNS